MTSAKVLIGSENRIKIESTRQSFSRFFKPVKEKQSTLEFLTNGEVDRLQNNTRAITFALIPFLQENLYFQSK